MEHYPSYRLEDFYSKSFREGGLTLQQIHTLYEHSQKRFNRKLEIEALMHGIDVNGESTDRQEGPSQPRTATTNDVRDAQSRQKEEAVPLFRDPSEYDGLSQEERDQMTKEMMAKHRQWVNGYMSWTGNKNSVGTQ